MDIMNLSNPLLDAIPGPRGRLLATLAQLEIPVTVRALARHAEVSHQTALNIVNDLSASGVVSATRAGNALLISLNRDHLLAEPLISMLRTRARLVQRLRTELATWPHLAAAWLFGSASQGTGDRTSDVDLLLVAETSMSSDQWVGATAQLMESVLLWTGNQPQLVEHTRHSFEQLARSDGSLISAVRADGIALTPQTGSLFRRTA